MKRILAALLTLSFLLVMTGCGADKSRKDIIKLVEKNYDAIVTACENKDAETLLAIDGITKVVIVDGYVLVYCKGTGNSASSQDYGFYYSEENQPVAVDCNLQILHNTLLPEGDGYQCTVNHNTFYTEQIAGKLYFYSNAY